MPIPLMQIEEQVLERKSTLRLVQESSVYGEPRPFLLYPRALAHMVDVGVVAGFSMYSSKLFSVILVALHAKAINGSGRFAGAAFRDAYAYSSGQLLAASFASLSLLYFVALPLVLGRTPGFGLFGLKVYSDNGHPMTMRQFLIRMLGCSLNYATGGLLCVIGLRKRDGRFVQDMVSGSRVVKE